MGGVEREAPHGGSYFLDLTAKGSDCARQQKIKALGGNSGKVGEAGHMPTVHIYYRVDSQKCHTGKMFTGCLCSS